MLSLVAHPYFKHDIEQETMRKTLLTKQETEHFEWFYSFLLFPSIME